MDKFFNPRSVAVVGASREESKVGHGIMKNIVSAGFKGDIYPINPKADSVLGHKCWPAISDVPGPVDLAVVAVPARFVLDTVRDAGRKGVPACVIISAGFRETGPEGAKHEAALAAEASSLGIRLIGPNCLGIVSTHSCLNATFAAGTPATGSIAFFSQSGALCTAILDWSRGETIGFSKFVSLGNKADIDESDLMEYLGNDTSTDVILGYVEGVKNGRRFMDVATLVSRKKPVIIVKSGTTAAGARAASSHTGTLAGSEQAFKAAFDQCGIIHALTVQDLFDYALAFAGGRRAAGNRVAVVTNAGGPGIIAADAIEKSRLRMAEFAPGTIEKLRSSLPQDAAIYNPVDVIGDADETRYQNALSAAERDPNVDILMVILTPQISTKPLEVARVLTSVAKSTAKPVGACFMGGPAVEQAIRTLSASSIPNFSFPERAVRALEALSDFAEISTRKKERAPRIPANTQAAARLLAESRNAGEIEISDAKARRIVEAYGFRVPRSEIAADPDQAAATARRIGFPVAMKVASPDILHKSDIGAVKINLAGEDDAREACRQILKNCAARMPDARIWGVTVQEMIEPGREVILGMSKDPQFGPMVMLGLGGIYVEVMKDVSFRIAPLNRSDADLMIQSLRSYPLLRGVRGEKTVDIDALRDGILMLSQFVTDFPEVLEMDINPLRLFPGKSGAVAIDVRITIKEAQS